ncbi:MAG: hypothetical protein ACI4TH_05050 [Candidatus Ornithomonoglobus sp.]
MISKKATAAIAVCAGAVIIAGGLFGIYKHFVTPDKIVALSLINAKRDAEKTIEYFDTAEKEIMEDFFEDGGKFEADFMVSDSAVLDGMSFSVKSNSDGDCTVSEIGIENGLTIETYKDSKQIYINMPIFKGGFEIPVADFAQKWNTSIFKDIVSMPNDYSMSGIAAGFVAGKYSVDEIKDNYGRYIKDEVYQMLCKNPINQNGSAAVMVGNKIKKAKVYTTKIDKGTAEALLVDIAADYIQKTNNEQDAQKVQKLRDMFASYADDYVLSFKIANMTLREINLKNTADDSWTIALEGIDNPFDIIVCYKDDNIQDAVRRVHNSNDNELSESIYFGENGRLIFEESSSMLNVKLSLDDWDMDFNAYGRAVTDDKISYDSAELTVDGICTLSGSFSVSDEYDRDFSFNKSGQYVNLLEIGQDEWEAVTGTLLKGIELLS